MAVLSDRIEHHQPCVAAAIEKSTAHPLDQIRTKGAVILGIEPQTRDPALASERLHCVHKQVFLRTARKTQSAGNIGPATCSDTTLAQASVRLMGRSHAG